MSIGRQVQFALRLTFILHASQYRRQLRPLSQLPSNGRRDGRQELRFGVSASFLLFAETTDFCLLIIHLRGYSRHPTADVDIVVNECIRGAFEYQGSKCSALSRLYVPASLWNNGGLKEKLVSQVGTISVGPVNEFQHFMGPVIAQTAFQRIMVSLLPE